MRDARLFAANDNCAYRFYVYAWLRPDGQPFYVGKGTGRRDVRPKSNNPIFMRIDAKIRASGDQPRVVRWQEGLREDDALRIEMAYIKLFGRVDIGNGILSNLTDGGEGNSGWVPDADARQKISKAKTGKSHSAETKAKISATQIGRVHTDEARAKMSAAHRGVPRSEEVKAKISATHAGKSIGDDHLAKLHAVMRMAPPKSGFKGVHAIGRRWRASIRINKKNKYIGTFDTPEQAAIAYDKEAIAAWGHGKCYINAPLDKFVKLP